LTLDGLTTGLTRLDLTFLTLLASTTTSATPAAATAALRGHLAGNRLASRRLGGGCGGVSWGRGLTLGDHLLVGLGSGLSGLEFEFGEGVHIQFVGFVHTQWGPLHNAGDGLGGGISYGLGRFGRQFNWRGSGDRLGRRLDERGSVSGDGHIGGHDRTIPWTAVAAAATTAAATAAARPIRGRFARGDRLGNRDGRSGGALGRRQGHNDGLDDRGFGRLNHRGLGERGCLGGIERQLNIAGGVGFGSLRAARRPGSLGAGRLGGLPGRSSALG
jgi:hypothetical protein